MVYHQRREMRWTADLDGLYISVNADWTLFTGQQPGEASGEGWQAAVHPADLPVLQRLRAEARLARKPLNLRYRLRSASEAYFWVSEHVAPRLDPQSGGGWTFEGRVSLLVAAGSEPLSAYGSVDAGDLDLIADHLLTARQIIKGTDDHVLEHLVDMTLMMLGDRLRQRLGDQDRQNDPDGSPVPHTAQ